jgi:hypothetical protein
MTRAGDRHQPSAWAREAQARIINAQPWEPLPGMVKRRCSRCSYWFATRDPATERCPDCLATERRRLASAAAYKAKDAPIASD